LTKNAPIWAGDRNISALPVYGTGNNFANTITPQGRFIIATPIGGQPVTAECGNVFGAGIGNCTTPIGSNGWNTPNDPDLITFTNDSRFNFAPDNYLLSPQERKSIYVQGNYQFN